MFALPIQTASALAIIRPQRSGRVPPLLIRGRPAVRPGVALNGNRDTDRECKGFLTDSNSSAAADRPTDRPRRVSANSLLHIVSLSSRSRSRSLRSVPLRPPARPRPAPLTLFLSPRFQSSKIVATPNPIGRNKPAPRRGAAVRSLGAVKIYEDGRTGRGDPLARGRASRGGVEKRENKPAWLPR